MNRGHVVVVGGGAIGAASAYFLSRAHWQVTLVDRGRFAGGCSHGNCGYVSPSHVLPLSEPGVVGRTLKALCQPNSPFAIRPRLDPRFWLWLMRFAARANHGDLLESGHAISALLNSSAGLYRRLLAEEGIQCEWEQRGLLFVFHEARQFEHYAETNRLLAEEFQMPAVRYDAPALVELEPALRPGVAAGAWHYEGDAHLRPDRLMSELARVLRARQVTIHEQREVTGLARDGSRAAAVETSGGPIAADAFVFATGSWTPLLAGMLGVRVPIEPGKGYSITMPRPERCPKIPMIFHEHRVAVTPMKSAYRLGSTMEFAGYDTSIHPRRVALLTDAARLFLHEPVAEPVLETWYGWRPMTTDSKPVIDRCPGLQNVVIAAGHNMLGVSMAPATGKLVAELLGGEQPHVPLGPYRVTRF